MVLVIVDGWDVVDGDGRIRLHPIVRGACIANDVVLYQELRDVRLQSLCVTKFRASKTHA